MTPEAMRMMALMLGSENAPKGGRLIDIGSLNVNGTYRPLAEELGFSYLGVDIRPGLNVDQVIDPYFFPFHEGSFDAVISGSTMEHVERPWQWLPACARLVRPGGILAVVTHWKWELHEHPKDYWRFMPDGLKVLFAMCRVTPPIISMDPEGHIMGYAFK